MANMARVAQAQDELAVFGLWRRFMSEENEVISEENAQRNAEAWRERLKRQIAARQVAVLDSANGPAGFLAFISAPERNWVPDGVAYIVDLYIVPEARTSTACWRLWRAAEGLLSGRFRAVWVNTHRQNTRMQTLLKRARFVTLDHFAIAGLSDQLYFQRDCGDAFFRTQ